jgi:glycosyltransferase involved in cell wall biosynthesis
MSDEQREEVYKTSHFNLLLSLDHSHLGYIEGFGLSCLEAGKYGTPSIVLNTGGLPDNIHPAVNGVILESTTSKEIQKLIPFLNEKNYNQLRESTFGHTITAHGLDQYLRLFKRILQ